MKKVEEKFNLKLFHAVSLLVILVLNILWLVSLIIVMAKSKTIEAIEIISIAGFLGAAFYAIYGFKKPHGNLLRYVLLFFSLVTGAILVLFFTRQGVLYNSCYVLIVLLTAYMAGRLHKFKHNLVICILVLLLECVNVYPFISLNSPDGLTVIEFFSSIGSVTSWLAIATSYLTRFKLHREAGFEDKK